MTNNMQRATAAIALSIFGAAFLTVAGLWPVDTWAVDVAAAIGWICAGVVVLIIRSMG